MTLRLKKTDMLAPPPPAILLDDGAKARLLWRPPFQRRTICRLPRRCLSAMPLMNRSSGDTRAPRHALLSAIFAGSAHAPPPFRFLPFFRFAQVRVANHASDERRFSARNTARGGKRRVRAAPCAAIKSAMPMPHPPRRLYRHQTPSPLTSVTIDFRHAPPFTPATLPPETILHVTPPRTACDTVISRAEERSARRQESDMRDV